MSVVVAFEGDTDQPIVEKILHAVGLSPAYLIDCGGKDTIDKELASYNRAAKGSPWFVVRDLDHDANCASDLLKKKKFSPEKWMCFRLAVRELESWLLADVHGVSRFFEVPKSRVPANPDLLDYPTRALVDLARHSSKGRIKRGMVPKTGRSVAVGPSYDSLLIEFGRDHWSLPRALSRSDSLFRAVRAMRALALAWKKHASGR